MTEGPQDTRHPTTGLAFGEKQLSIVRVQAIGLHDPPHRMQTREAFPIGSAPQRHHECCRQSLVIDIARLFRLGHHIFIPSSVLTEVDDSVNRYHSDNWYSC